MTRIQIEQDTQVKQYKKVSKQDECKLTEDWKKLQKTCPMTYEENNRSMAWYIQ